ncbi:Hypothetical predicted protein [Octopus vulgaris]|uniref:Uncharacterized protein n=1 Tax=Octopus vulgaris TaxID=6645 RepID=A0AA36B7S3_OCTVU|nr:Hypothetical predicted protein [Octopus vulgaris]
MHSQLTNIQSDLISIFKDRTTSVANVLISVLINTVTKIIIDGVNVTLAYAVVAVIDNVLSVALVKK